MNHDELMKWYDASRTEFVDVCDRVKPLVEQLMKSAKIDAIVTGRVKERESFEDKLRRKGYTQPLQITDLAGLRIVVDSLNDVDKSAEIVAAEFQVDDNHSFDVIQRLKVSEFGYRSKHYIATISRKRIELPEWTKLIGMKIEIQIRTQIQNAWATIEHKYSYKAQGEIPFSLRRRVFQAMALLETADEQLNSFGEDFGKLQAAYDNNQRSRGAELDLNHESLRNYVNSSPEIKSWVEFVSQHCYVQLDGLFQLNRDLQIARFVGFRTIEEIKQLLLTAGETGENFLRFYYSELSHIHGGRPQDFRFPINSILTNLMIRIYHEKFDVYSLVRLGFEKADLLELASQDASSHGTG